MPFLIAASPAYADESLAVDTSLVVDGQASTSKDGGRRGVAAMLDVKLLFDGAPVGAEGLSGMADVAVYGGAGISGSLGDLQGVSSVAATRMVRPLNAWLQYSRGAVAIKAGLMDTNADFDEQNIGATFLNSSHAMGLELSGSGLNGSGTAPYSALGVVGFLTDEASGIKFRTGVFTGQSGDPDSPRKLAWHFGHDAGTFSIAELDWTGEGLRLAVGGWRHSSRLPRIDGNGFQRGSYGGFATVEATLAGRTADPETGAARGARLDGWVRFGLADGATAPITHYAGGGLLATGLWQRHPDDAVGIAVAHAAVNRAAGPDVGPETSLELTYQHALGSGLTIQPDVQWLLNPGGDRTRRDAVVFGLRLIAVH